MDFMTKILNQIKMLTIISEISEINSKIFKMSTSETNDYGSGGMLTKIQAAEIAFTFGCDTIIMKGNGKKPNSKFRKKYKHGTFLNLKRQK